jgi:hypothetical protein
MSLLKQLRFKVPERYEDIVGFGDLTHIKLGKFQKLRLFLFFVKYPNEFERYERDFEAQMIRRVGRDYYDRINADPQGEMEKLRKEIRRLREEIPVLRKEACASRKERSGLVGRVDDLQSMLDVKEVL